MAPSIIMSTFQRAATTAFVMFLAFGTPQAIVATVTSLGFDAINDQNLSMAWMTMGQLLIAQTCPKKYNESEKNVAKGEMPAPVFSRKIT